MTKTCNHQLPASPKGSPMPTNTPPTDKWHFSCNLFVRSHFSQNGFRFRFIWVKFGLIGWFWNYFVVTRWWWWFWVLFQWKRRWTGKLQDSPKGSEPWVKILRLSFFFCSSKTLVHVLNLLNLKSLKLGPRKKDVAPRARLSECQKQHLHGWGRDLARKAGALVSIIS